MTCELVATGRPDAHRPRQGGCRPEPRRSCARSASSPRSPSRSAYGPSRCAATSPRPSAELVLATPEERRTHVPADRSTILVLDDWHHPDTVSWGRSPATRAAFRSPQPLVLATGDIGAYDAERAGESTHWSNWPDGGSL